MTSVRCGVCRDTVVRHGGDVCATCRFKGHKALKDTRVPEGTAKEFGALQPLDLIETVLKQARTMAARLQANIDQSESYRPDTVQEMFKVSQVLALLTKEWRQCRELAKDLANQMNQEDRVEKLKEWFAQLPSTQQRELIQGFTQVYNEAAV